MVKNALMHVMVMKSQLVKSVMEMGSTSLALNLISIYSDSTGSRPTISHVVETRG